MKTTKLTLITLMSVALMTSGAIAQSWKGNNGYDEDNPFANNAAFWEGLDAEEEPYEHDFTTIPDLIDN